MTQVETWMQQVDDQIGVHQVRQFLQTTTLASEPVLRDLLVHHLHKSAKTPERPRQDRFPARAVLLVVRALGSRG